ncbi:MAG: cytidylate kinase-like family protein [Gemmatimonadota bacterium]|jgi:cytidylate kinase
MNEGTVTDAPDVVPTTRRAERVADTSVRDDETMQIVCISRGSLSRGAELAEALARKLGYAVLSREDLIEAATAEGIQVGKLEMSMMKPHTFTERLARERDLYLAFSTAYLCDRLQEGPLVYHGRTGHLLLRSVSHVLRVRVVADDEYRVAATMAKLGLDRARAVQYLAEVEEDRRAWVRSMYGVSWEDASQYDVVLNVERMNVDNAATALLGMTRLPDFRMTPASRRAMEDLHLGARTRLRLARDRRTSRYDLSVRAHGGLVSVTYLPHDMEVAEEIPRILEGLEGMREVRVSVAGTTILWIQEAFDPAQETFSEIVELARRWSAAVELLRFVPSGEDSEPQVGSLTLPPDPAVEGGIQEDQPDEVVDDGGLKETLDELARVGMAGSGRYVHAGRGSLLASCCSTVPPSLAVVGDVYLSKDPGARVRLVRELQEAVADRLRIPVVTPDELRGRYMFGRRDLVRLLGFLAVVVALYVAVFTHQEPVLRFLKGDWTGAGGLSAWVVAVAVFLFVPIVAYVYGGVAGSLMKLIQMD